ncbi:MAG TPA: universal stress protein [Terriglobales bacterium]
MFPAKKIVCPTDFSDGSFQALKEATELATQFGSEICLIHVLPAIPGTTDAVIPEPQVLRHDEVEIQLRSIGAPLMSKGIPVKYVVVDGDEAEQIVRTAEELGADLIVIATHGNTGWRHLAFGSVTEKVVRLATCPVLTIRMKSAHAAKAA